PGLLFQMTAAPVGGVEVPPHATSFVQLAGASTEGLPVPSSSSASLSPDAAKNDVPAPVHVTRAACISARPDAPHALAHRRPMSKSTTRDQDSRTSPRPYRCSATRASRCWQSCP